MDRQVEGAGQKFRNAGLRCRIYRWEIRTVSPDGEVVQRPDKLSTISRIERLLGCHFREFATKIILQELLCSAAVCGRGRMNERLKSELKNMTGINLLRWNDVPRRGKYFLQY